MSVCGALCRDVHISMSPDLSSNTYSYIKGKGHRTHLGKTELVCCSRSGCDSPEDSWLFLEHGSQCRSAL